MIGSASEKSCLVYCRCVVPVARQLGALGIVASLMASVGIMAYKQWLFHTSWRKIYVWVTLVVMFFSLFQLLLIFR